jgi:ABC-type phosphate transport system auxiliary subunit
LIAKTLTLLLQLPEVALETTGVETIRQLDMAGTDVLCDIVDAIKVRSDLTSSAIIERFRGTVYYDRLCELASTGTELEDSAVRTEFTDAMIRLHLMAIDQETRKIAASSSKLSEEDKQKLRDLQRERLELKK